MITKEMIQNSSSQAKYLKKFGKTLKVVLTSEEMQNELDNGKTTIYTIHINAGKDKYWFYTDDYSNGASITWGENKITHVITVPVSTIIPHDVVRREGLENGRVTDTKSYEFVYCKDSGKQILSLDEYLEILNNYLI